MSVFGWRKLLERTGFLFLAGGLFLLGIVQGFSSSEVQFSFLGFIVDIVFLDAIAATLMFSLFLSVSGFAYLFEILRRKNGDKIKTGGEKLGVIIPVYKDSKVLSDAVESVLESNYSPIELTIVYENDDKASKKEAQRLENEFDEVKALKNKSEDKNKAGAINYGFENTDAEIIGLIDADQKLNPKFLPHAVHRLSERDVVQGRRVPIPEGVVESLSYYEKIMFRLSGQVLKLLNFDMVLSSSTVMKKEIWERLGGYDSSKITEDLDYGHRCFRNHVDTCRADKYPTYMEAPHSLKDLWGQKKRWMLGQIQILHSNLGSILRGNVSRRMILSTSIVSITVLGNLLMLTLIPKFLLLVLFGWEFTAAYPLVLLTLVGLFVRVADSFKEEIDGIGWEWILIVLTYPIYSLIMIKSIFEYIFTWSGEWYHVEKG